MGLGRNNAATGERRSRVNSTHRMVFLTVVIISSAFLLVDLLVLHFARLSEGMHQVVEAATLAITGAVAIWFTVIRPLRAEADAERRISRDREAALVADGKHREFEAALHRAVEMAGTEEAVYRVTEKALSQAGRSLAAELLLADSSDAHLKRAVAVGGESSRARCGVVAPRDCPAIRRAQTLTFASSEGLDACPHLDNREAGPCAAVCVPVSVGGRSIGVLHSASEVTSPPSEADTAALEAIAAQAGSRIGMLRVMEATHLQAATDPLTGLLNRRSLENRAQDLVRRGVPFALAMCDLDHFKQLNDTHGHDAGDRALRAFSQTLRAALREDDIVCRYGGEEFVILFPRRSTDEAAAALERVQEELLLAAAGGTIPAFTASFGVAHSDTDSGLEELCRVADMALFRAKREGRNRVVIDDSCGDIRKSAPAL